MPGQDFGTPGDEVVAIINELRQKCGSFSRCFKEYGTYLDELQADKERLEQLRKEGKETRQQEQVIRETQDMIGITEKNARKMADAFMKFWEESKPKLDSKLNNLNEEQRRKTADDCGTYSRLLSKALKEESAERIPIDADMLSKIRDIQTQLDNLCGSAGGKR